MNKETFTGKTFVEAFSFTTANKPHLRYDTKEVVIDGRMYIKTGRFQAVTFVGHKYRTEDGKTLLFVGMSLQNPMDVKEDNKIAETYAEARVLVDPCIMMEVGKHFSNADFSTLMYLYLQNLKLDYVKTRAERIAARKKAADENCRAMIKIHEAHNSTCDVCARNK